MNCREKGTKLFVSFLSKDIGLLVRGSATIKLLTSSFVADLNVSYSAASLRASCRVPFCKNSPFSLSLQHESLYQELLYGFNRVREETFV